MNNLQMVERRIFRPEEKSSLMDVIAEITRKTWRSKKF